MSIRSWAPLTWAKGPNDDTEQINKQNANAGDTITDDITVTGSNGFEGTVTSVLYGPVAPLGSPAAATCVGVDYTNAPVAGTFEVEVDGDGTYTTAPFTVLVAGCYTYSETLNTVPPVGPSMRGRSSETVLVFPKVTTQISKQTANVGDTITDDIKVFGSGSYKGLVNWTLLGPVAPRLTSSGAQTCEGVVWTNAPVASRGSITANGDGVYKTAGYKVQVAGCYTYIEMLVGDTTTPPTTPSTPGLKSETVLVFPKTPPVLGVTGPDMVPVALTGLGLLMIGGAAVFATRRRRVVWITS